MIIDLGPSYLPKRSRFPAMAVPFIAWSDRANLPPYLWYDLEIDFTSLAQLDLPKEVIERMDKFVERCKKRYASQRGNPKLSNWILRDQETLLKAAKNKDPWALQLTLYPERLSQLSPPFQ